MARAPAPCQRLHPGNTGVLTAAKIDAKLADNAKELKRQRIDVFCEAELRSGRIDPADMDATSPPTSKPGTPDSLTVGTSGASGLRFTDVMAMGLTLPLLAMDCSEMMESSRICTWPPATSARAGAVPR